MCNPLIRNSLLACSILQAPLLFAQTAGEPVVSTFIEIMATAGMSVDADGNLYIADFGDINTLAGTSLFKVSPSGEATLITDQLSGPSGNLIDTDGSILQSEYLLNRVSRVTADGTITTFASGIPGPDDVVQDANGNLFVAACPFGGPAPGVYRVDTNGTVERFASDASFSCISGVTIDDTGDLYTSDFGTGQISRVTPAGEVTVFAQLPVGSTHIKFANDGFYTFMPAANQVVRIERDGSFSILAGTGERGNVDGPASQAQFSAIHIEVSPDERFLFIDGGPNGDNQTNPVRIIDLMPQMGQPVVPRLRAITGGWFNADRDGEGFLIQTVDDRDVAVVFWATYDENGGQEWFTGLGDFSGDQLSSEMLVTSGGVFGDAFDPSQVVRTPVGNIVMTMNDCNTITLDYEINGQTGQQELTRVYSLEGQVCVEGDGSAAFFDSLD